MSSTTGVMGSLHKKYKSFKKKALSCMGRGKERNSQELQEYLNCMNADNSALTRQLKDTQHQLEKAEQENLKLKSDREAKEVLFEKDKTVLAEEIKCLKAKINEKCVYVEEIKEEMSTLRRESEGKDVLLKQERESKKSLKEEVDKLQQEVAKLNKALENQTLNSALLKDVNSLRGVLDRRHSRIKSIKTALAETKQNEIALDLSMEKMSTLRAKFEDLQEQLKRKMADRQLPAGWAKQLSRSTGLHYYSNVYTKESQWDVPGKPAEPISSSGLQQIRCSHLLVTHKDARQPSSWREENVTRTEEEALDLVKSYREQIVQGQAYFAYLAFRYSDCSSAKRGGDLGLFDKGTIRKAFEEAAFGLRVGELSVPVFTDLGVHIILRTK